YKKLESEAAVEAFKLNMEKLAKGQGKRRAGWRVESNGQRTTQQPSVNRKRSSEAFPRH
ncbi:unnamed protein product, partial [Porites lobata]